MPEVFVYLFKINIAISLFYCGYYFFLRKLTFYSLNRIYILFSILLSVIFPFLSFPPIFSEPEIISYNFPTVEGAIERLPQIEDSQSIAWLALTLVYWAFVIFGSFRFIGRLISLYRVHLKSIQKHWNGYKFNNLILEVTPFSFLNKTYLNANKHTEQELHTILKHEAVHTKSLHSLDILLIEIWTIFSWFNPISWLFKKAIKVNSEFIADQEIIRQGVSCKFYQKSLLHFATQTQNIPLTNQFSFISLKSRITMMNKKQSSKKQLGKYFLIVLIIVVSLFAFGISKAYEVSEPFEIFLQVRSPEKSLSQDTIEVRGVDTIAKSQERIVIKAIGDTSDFKFENALLIIDGVQQEKTGGKNNLSDIPQEKIQSISILKKEHAMIYGKRGENGVILITTKEKEKSLRGSKSTSDIEIRNNTGKTPLIIINGKESDNKPLRNMKPDQIESFSIIKDKEAIKIYGEKGENGVILITTKEKAKDVSGEKKTVVSGDGPGKKVEEGVSQNSGERISVSGIDASLNKSKPTSGPEIRINTKEEPLIVIDGKESDQESMKKINPDQIESISVLKDEKAIKVYGEKGKNGVIEIILK